MRLSSAISICLLELSESVIFPVILDEFSSLHHYYALVNIGTPPQEVPLLIDTSSSHTYLKAPDQDDVEYDASESSTFSWLTCMEENCNVCLDGAGIDDGSNSGDIKCAWRFACEQIYVMAKDVWSSDVDLSGDNETSSLSQNDHYLVFGYNDDAADSSHSLQVHQHNAMRMGGILSLNRQRTSFTQQMYLGNVMRNIFGHIFHKAGGYIAFGEDVDQLIDLLDIVGDDISWTPYWDEYGATMYHTVFERLALSPAAETTPTHSTLSTIFDGTGDVAQNLRIVTFDAGITGMGLNFAWKDALVLSFTNLSGIELVASGSESLCFNESADHSVADLPDLQIQISSSLTLTISPEQYTIETAAGAWCLDISFDWDDGVCLGSHAMEHYLILYDDATRNIGVFDNNTKHQKDVDVDTGADTEEEEDTIGILNDAEERHYLYALSLAVLAVLICLVCVAMVCVVLVRRVSRRKRGASIWRWVGGAKPRRQSITIDLSESPRLRAEHIVMDDNSPQKLQLERQRDERGGGKAAKTKGLGHDRSKAYNAQLSPQKYYDGNFKSIVYDRVIRPRHLEHEMQQQEQEQRRRAREQEDFDAL